ncbi:MAG: DUF1186 domain-containing protein [Eubacteriales bacterium]|nr:DUF1186 domain-containing protein [Eubacteriales bacterium]
MNQIQEAIEEITYLTPKFPEEAFAVITQNPQQVREYLYSAIDYAIQRQDELEENYILHLYALYLCAQFKDRNSFERIIALVSLPSDTVDGLIGDAVTEDLHNILYNTYNGNLPLLQQCIRNFEIDNFVRSAMLDVMGQLYMDGVLCKEELQSFLRELVYLEAPDCIWYTNLLGVICKCHFIELLPEIRYLFEEDCIEEFVYGEYDDCVDQMFDYSDEGFCASSISAADRLRHWAMFADNCGGEALEDFEDAFKKMKTNTLSGQTRKKIGRNDPCPCGSGKKYKKCCLNKDNPRPSYVESPEEQMKWLKDYPQTGAEKVEGRIYLDDFFDSESIEIDKLVYLALKHRAIPVWERESENLVKKRKLDYLWRAFCKFEEKMCKEQLGTSEEYDKKYSIHYMCSEWMEILAELLRKEKERGKYNKVLQYLE